MKIEASEYSMRHPLVLDFVLNSKWAITPEYFDIIQNAINGEGDIAQAATLRAERLSEFPREMKVLNGTAVIPVTGVLTPRASMFAEVSGLKSTSALMEDFAAAIDDKSVKSIVLLVSSPGGAVEGISEFGQMIFNSRGIKPIVSFVRGSANSAAYWIAAASDKIVISESSDLGSIGVFSTYTDNSEATKREGVRKYEIVSSISPKKRITPADAEGAKAYQTMVDDLAGVMVANIAKFRGKTSKEVEENFGQGFVVVGQKAIDAGMADEIGTFESVLADLQKTSSNNSQGVYMKDGENTPTSATFTQAQLDAAVTAAVAEATAEGSVAIQAAFSRGVDHENSRIAKINALKAPGYQSIIAENLLKKDATAETVSALILEAQSKKAEAAASDRADDGADVAAAAGGQGAKPDASTDKDEEDTVAAMIAAGANAGR